ncbi:hypothetical protein CYLTODRAFT_484683 [Cylindrobasidium torrendii FP15055 ss-10]|uniref:R3H-associated N-terminal domain-containing protein n=1 Tax=Cylindrobasidium torrendii FP15055 ss-10 TaxID=1314674 RepID=A0A0D7BVC4_9AGAR|nr:hypothetical protein CYLTODRAFT_484683 [Cylindrobasidium torrendii FP15055 ss-10]
MEPVVAVENTEPVPATALPEPTTGLLDPIPLSFPAFLRNPGIQDQFAHLNGVGRKSTASAIPRRTRRRDENDGKRWVRRKENERFIGNPHIVLASSRDYRLDTTRVKSTFPEPLPPYLHRSAKVPAPTPPTFDAGSANAGRFSLSLKGMRRELRRCGRRAQLVVRDVEAAMTEWLHQAGAVLPNDPSQTNPTSMRPMVGEAGIAEVSRTPFQIVWSIPDDAFARYVVHCCARYHEVVSYSKEVNGERLTYLLRPNVTRPNLAAPSTLATPPATDIDSSSHFDSEEPISDFTDIELSDVDEGVISLPDSPVVEAVKPSVLAADDTSAWSVSGGESDLDADMSELEPAMGALAISDVGRTPRQTRQARTRVLSSQMRSASSPSRSPAPVRVPILVKNHTAGKQQKPTFYAYLFS